jgi:hypothetical protein
MRGVGEVLDDERRDEPSDEPRHPDARRMSLREAK